MQDSSWRFADRPYLTCEYSVVSPPVAVLRVTGELDLSTQAVLADAVADVLRVGGVEHLELDLSGLRFMDLRGLEAVLAAERRMEARGGDLELLYPSHQVRRLLDLTELAHLAAH